MYAVHPLGNEYAIANGSQAFIRINFALLFPSSVLLMNDITHDPPIPLSIRVGDLSLDGFPDMMLIAASAPHGGVLGGGVTVNHTPYLLNSVPCARGIAGCDANGRGRRGFEVAVTGTDALRQITDARGIAVLDLDEDVSFYNCNA
jgi:integrin alpha FG-GAP repeat containing protein 1